MIIEEISRAHDRKGFNCGVSELDQFLYQQARQKTAKRISKTYVACEEATPTRVVGYYTLTGYAVTTPPEHRNYRNYPHPLHAVKLARLAVDRSHQGRNIGEMLLIDGMNRTALVAQQISAIGLFVDPMTSSVVSFYQQYGFLPVDSVDRSRLEMWLPIDTCIAVAKTLSGE